MQKTIKLPDTELEVMQAIWTCSSPVSRQDIDVIIQEKHPMALTTLLTILTRLEQKGFIRIEKKARHSLYYPLIAKETYLAEQSRRLLHVLCGGSISTFANALCDSGISKEELEELRTLLERNEL